MEEEGRNLVSWYRELAFLYSGNEGCVHLYFPQIPYPSFPLPLPGSSLFLALLGWGRGRRSSGGEAPLASLEVF